MKIKSTAVCLSVLRHWLQLHSLWEQKGFLQAPVPVSPGTIDGKDYDRQQLEDFSRLGGINSLNVTK
jgi:hypothetical protein